MKKPILFLFLCSFTFLCLGQNLEIEKLVNEASKTVVPKDFRFYNLVDSSFILNINHLTSYNPQLEKFIKNNPDFKLSEFLAASNNLKKMNWHDYKINGAHLYSYNDIPKFATHLQLTTIIPYKISKSELDSLNNNKKYNEVIVPVKKWWSKKKIKKEVQKKWNEQNERVILENKKYFKFSTPIFSLDFKYAIIELIIGGEKSTTYVLKKIDNNWIPFSVISWYIY